MSDIIFAATPPPGVTSNPNVPIEFAGLQVCTWIFMPIAFITVMIRLYTRTRIVGAVSIDDCKNVSLTLDEKSLISG